MWQLERGKESELSVLLSHLLGHCILKASKVYLALEYLKSGKRDPMPEDASDMVRSLHELRACSSPKGVFQRWSITEGARQLRRYRNSLRQRCCEQSRRRSDLVMSGPRASSSSPQGRRRSSYAASPRQKNPQIQAVIEWLQAHPPRRGRKRTAGDVEESKLFAKRLKEMKRR